MKDLLIDFLFITIGAVIAAFAIELFLAPNNIIDGGVLGISMMCKTIFKADLGFFVFVLNLPFILLAFKKFGLRFVLSTFYAVSVLSISLFFLHEFSGVTKDLILASIFGGIFLGLGVGIVLRNNASTDGTEIISIMIAKKTGFSIGEIIMFFNIFIFSSACFIYGFDNAMYSLLTYFIAYKMIDIVQEGLNETKSVIIISDFAEEIGQMIMKKMDASVTYMDAVGGYSGAPKKMVFFITSRLEIYNLKKIVKSIDPRAFIAIEDVYEVDGSRMAKK